MADMLADLLNQSGGTEWWSGQSPLSSKGTYAPTPAPADEPAAAAPTEPATPATSEPAATPAAGPAQPAQPSSSGNYWQKRYDQAKRGYESEIMRMKTRQASYPPGSERWLKYQQQIQKKIAHMNEQLFNLQGML